MCIFIDFYIQSLYTQLIFSPSISRSSEKLHRNSDDCELRYEWKIGDIYVLSFSNVSPVSHDANMCVYKSSFIDVD